MKFLTDVTEAKGLMSENIFIVPPTPEGEVPGRQVGSLQPGALSVRRAVEVRMVGEDLRVEREAPEQCERLRLVPRTEPGRDPPAEVRFALRTGAKDVVVPLLGETHARRQVPSCRGTPPEPPPEPS
jgi:hypothetical protein